ncbi:DUF6777 domain-containing protein [Actinoplanes subglobosus]|uniref:DUF6777 domain-containing protein n=1 Tax=Actinoplanes subglobosus TaxID=1547892 RepID=A0ABV8IYJ3_9ACTN
MKGIRIGCASGVKFAFDCCFYCFSVTEIKWAGKQRIGRKSVACAVLLALLIAVGGTSAACSGPVLVQAVARGAKTVAPFFDEALELGIDAMVDETFAIGGGTKKGDQPGLYGGTRNKKSCAKKRLTDFLGDPANRGKAQEWARVQGLAGPGEIRGFVRKLTPVVLRNDTLVKNHDYREGKAEAYEALLEAGIAVLVDEYGKPVVKCTCGNPLGSFDHDTGSLDVQWESARGKWKSYRPEKVVKIEPAAGEPLAAYELVDLEEGTAGLTRAAGVLGDAAEDETLSADPFRDQPGEAGPGAVGPDVDASSTGSPASPEPTPTSDGMPGTDPADPADPADLGTPVEPSPVDDLGQPPAGTVD